MAKISVEEVQQKIDRVEHHAHGPVTLCIITTVHGFPVTGQAICPADMSPDSEKGKRLAYRSAFSQLMLMERYVAHIEQKAEESPHV